MSAPVCRAARGRSGIDCVRNNHLDEALYRWGRKSSNRPVYAASRMSEGRKLSSLRSHFFNKLAPRPLSDCEVLPIRIGLRHGSNQDADVRGDRRSASPSSTLPRPPQAKALTMPGEDGLGSHNDECRSPVGPRARQPRPEPTVGLNELHATGLVRCSTCS